VEGRSGNEKIAVNKIVRAQSRIHHSVRTSAATWVAEATVKLVFVR